MNIQNKQSVTTDQKQGFTIIEVVLVLAIAGLIFLMVFLALPALQRGQRDNQRQQDLSRISTQVNAFSQNARGKVPTESTLGDFVENYLGGPTSTQASGEYSDPSGVPETADENISSDGGYIVRYQSGPIPGVDEKTTGIVYYSAGTVCRDDGSGSVDEGKARNFTLRAVLENQATPYCIDNQ